MGKIAIILRKLPYGDINAAEAVRHALGGVSDDFEVSLVLVDGGVLLAKKGQDDADTGFTNLGDTLNDCIDMDVNVYADKLSVEEHSLETTHLIDGVRIVNDTDIAEVIKNAQTTMIF
jgi:sulfur relay (sulfurtransferase) DsrF/TusC family protein